MEIHDYEKLWFGLSLLLIVAFIGTVTYGAVGAGVEMVSDDGGTVEPEFGAVYQHEKIAQQQQAGPRAIHVEGNEYEVGIVAQRFAFIPGSGDPIEVPEDSEVTFYITSPDVIHGFSIVGTNVNTMVIPGQMSEITVEFDELAGNESKEYGIVCHEYCGSTEQGGHEDMAGAIRVVPDEQWNQSQEGDA
jgi:cytochrome c oxidase subunit 2